MYRENIKYKLSEHFNESKTNNIEKSIYNWCIASCSELHVDASWENVVFVHMYVQKCLEIIEHIENFGMKEDILNNTLLTKDVCNFNYKSYNKERWKPVIHETKLNSNDGIFQCKKCKSKKTTYYSLQTRSADEPMTNFITCLNCNNRWKM